ncbi:MAG: ArnT family glycosyltransferase, partial [Candidatus Hydrothermarchaeales archaeon]
MPKVMKKQTTDTPFLRKAIPITLSVWLLSLTIYYCFNVSWLSHFSSVQPGTKQLIVETLKFHWVPVFLSQLPYVFYALILNFIAILIGNRILRYLKVDFDSNISKIIFSIPLGWSIYSIGIFYLGVSKLLYKEAIYCFIMLLGVLSILEIKRFFREWKALTIISRYKIDKTDLICLPLIIIFITLQLVMSFSPVWTIDSMVYHMALPKLHIKQHTLVHVPGFLYGTLPAHTGMLYLLGLITSSEILSKLFSLSISLMFLISTFSIGNRYFSREVGYLAAIITMLSIPLFPCYFSQPFADASFGLFSLLGIYAFFMWIEEKKDGSLYLSIFCCASAAATKIQGLFFVLLFFAGFLVYASGRLKMNRQFRAKDGANLRILRKLAWFILVVGIIALPWYVRSWWLTGDPVFPFLYDYLGASASGEWNKYSNMCLWEFYSGHGFKGARSFSDIIRIAKALFFTGNINNSFSPII